MKKVVISTLAVLMAAPAFARGTGDSSWQLFGLDPYIGLRVGYSYNDLGIRHGEDRKHLSDGVWQGRAALGLEICDRVRGEVEWSIFSKADDTKNWGPEFGDIYVESTNLQTVMFNMFWELGDWQVVRPFVGLGAGVAFPDIKQTGFAYYDRMTSAGFSAMGALGVTFDMQYVAVDLAARYNYVEAFSGMHNIGADLGIRFMF